MRGLFVSATDTGVGKTILSAALVAAMRAAGVASIPHKPVLTGLDEPGPHDHEVLAAAANMAADEVAPLRYRPALSPHLAAELSGGPPIEPARLLAGARAAGDEGEVVVVEGVGGLMTPLVEGYTVRDFAAQLGLPLLIAARSGLGTINHSLLTLAAARAAGLIVRAVVLTPWTQAPSVLECSNRETIARMGEIEVAVLERVDTTRSELARAGSRLPWRRWLAADT